MAVILHIDMNAYFASVEEMSNPGLARRPVAVGGYGRAVIVTANYLARSYGVRTGMTAYQARKICPSISIIYGDLEKYTATSLRIHRLLLDFTELVEPASIDECYMDITSFCDKTGKTPADTASMVQQSIKQKLKLPCSIGISENKLLAKLASEMKKPDGITTLWRKEALVLFHTMPVEQLCGIGTALKRYLSGLNIKTVFDLGAAPISMLRAHFGINGYLLKDMGMGISSSKVNTYGHEAPPKSVGHNYTLQEDTSDETLIKAHILWLSMRVAKRLMILNRVGHTVSLTVRYQDFRTVSSHFTPGAHFSGFNDIYTHSAGLLGHIWQKEKAIRLIGISVSRLAEDRGQSFLFDKMQKKVKLEKVTDRINSLYGDLMIKPLSVMLAQQKSRLAKDSFTGTRLIQ